MNIMTGNIMPVANCARQAPSSSGLVEIVERRDRALLVSKGRDDGVSDYISATWPLSTPSAFCWRTK